MKLVPVDLIPKAENVKDVPLDNLMNIYKVYQDMEAICREENNALGLAAVQVGIPWRMFVIINNDGKYDCYLNCSYSSVDNEKRLFIEGCLSIRNEDNSIKTYRVERWKDVRIIGKKLLFEEDLALQDVNEILSSNESIVFQHEIDHQDGILISDIGEEFEVW